MNIDKYKTAYLEFWDVAETQQLTAPCEMMPYSFKTDIHGFVWSTMEREFTQELLNTINGFANQINSLNIWAHVLEKYNEEQQFYLRFEFTRLPLYYCLHKPTEFRDRLIYCGSHICHQANCSAVEGYKDNFAEDHLIKMKTLTKVSKHWRKATELIENIKLIASSDFADATGQYRNKSQHRVPPSLEYGHTNLVTRTELIDGKVSYGFGYADPITTEIALPLLIKQWELMKNAFNSYWSLVEEQNLTIKPK